MLGRNGVVLCISLLGAPGGALAAPSTSSSGGGEQNPDVLPRTRRSITAWVDPTTGVAADAAAAEHISPIIFINRCLGGCTLTPGLNDARFNTSSLVSSTTMIGEFPYSEDVYQEVVECVRDVYGPYAVQIVTEDPGSELHHESILAGDPSDLGLSGRAT
jgi:hypothetical protein